MRAEHEAEAGTGAEAGPGPGSGPAPDAGPADPTEGATATSPAAASADATSPAAASADAASPAAASADAASPAAGTERAAAESGAAAGSEAAKSRRFPSITQDTARPEGHGRAGPGDALAARQWPMLSVLAATAVGLLLTALGHPKGGCLVIGVALIAASVLRRVLPSVGMLAVRSRFTDMVTYGLLGVAITLLTLVMEPRPWLEISFLESAVRFTVR
ncbi:MULTISPECIES: DUF3017 domain-containing protein [unclassified Streptomyces]|uniref:DUF3017 domain-containing protein n=1 Tax=unclassified Streptomyces TaxID=2593676 RepID=UPI002E2B7BF7|nr:DUF3017 domain-containing protein [Streptomyces sp. NBC_00272]